jgi:hypothetical protein
MLPAFCFVRTHMREGAAKHFVRGIIPVLLCEAPPILLPRYAFPRSPDTVPIGHIGLWGKQS